ncbi:hypothetical protein [Roseivivax sediminis]|uniref:CVNH domain-containing protein n=1 Tax=Roseivivax sediminis TaxID=936889 RepID=A0A1I1T1J7_9RHOB|nr:hypothetical protein [Roseivivax sediminis]SFD52555.1 hypothetical protein SAMN04515678_101438 [Roseivivax sediminis]
MRALAVLAVLCAATTAQAQAALGTEAGCAHVDGAGSEAEDRIAILPGHLAWRDATCQIAGIQTGTLMASCAGQDGRFDLVLGIAKSPDGEGIVLTMPDGATEEVLYPCE